MPPSDAERLARLEAQQQEAERVHQALFDRMKGQEAVQKEIRDDVGEIKQKLSGYKGFFGGVAFMLTAMGGLIGAALMSVWQTLTGGSGN